ncbi:MAG: pyrroloquinoline quinone biosynthesis peptide chaperone PqqD [Verrucomicrobiota bacterium]
MTPLDPTCRPAFAPGVRLQADKLTGEPVLLYPEGVLVLNATAHEIAQRCDGRTPVGAIVAALAAEYEVDEATLRADVAECLSDLLTRRLLVIKP